MKYLLTEKQILFIGTTYSIRGCEFEFKRYQSDRHKIVLQHKKIVGYYIFIEEEELLFADGNAEKTGRLKITHTDASGNILCTDYWIINYCNGDCTWQLRNPKNSKKADYEILKDLENENEMLKKYIAELQQRN